VAQDGTCNGLQHYAALGGDPEGARQVNLEPSDKPQDVYTGVAELVKKQIEEDLKAGNEYAKLLQGHITRKVVKQSVMTNVYGVTFVGARAQIQNQLKDNPAIPREKQLLCASYVAHLVFASIKEVFTGATDIQHWLALSARMISRSVSPAQYQHLQDHSNGKLSESKNPHIRRKGKVEFMTSVVWTTPLRMAIVQPYRQESSVVVQTNLQKVYISDPSAIDQVNSRKQMTAFPPNFIHSLDATHMLLSAAECAEQGLTFASVHDSFWTHPNNVDDLNRILRDAFIKLHSEDIMQKLKEEFETRYKGYKYLVSIPSKSTHATLIKLARQEYAKNVLGKSNVTVVEDLQWELERDRLLDSADPVKRQKGENMITPSIILQKAGGAKATEVKEPLGAELGNVDAKEGLAEKEGVNSISNPDDEGAEVRDVVNDEAGSLEKVDMTDDTEAEDDSEEVPSTLEVSKKKKTSKPQQAEEHVWMPLKFLPLPPKVCFVNLYFDTLADLFDLG
jgi:DNA-directed RNA polymerase